MKKTISFILSFVMLLSVTAGIDFSAFAEQREFTLDDRVNDKSYTFTVTDDDYDSCIYDFVAEKLGVNADDVYVILGTSGERVKDGEDANNLNNKVSNYIDAVDSLKEEGFDVNGEIIIDSVWSAGDNYNEDWLGNYDETNEYHIRTAYDMAAFYKACYIDGYTFERKTVYIDNDIDLSEHFWMVDGLCLLYLDDESTTPAFSGVLDGKKNTIYGLRLYPVNGFAVTAGLLPNIKNAVIKDLYVYGEATRANVDYFGFISGYARDSAIVNCYAQGTIECVGRDRKYNVGAVGALIGEMHHCAVINCGANADISLDCEHLVKTNYFSSYSRIGALIGRATNDEEDSYCVINSFAHGSIHIINSIFSKYIGGFIGMCDDDIYNCYADVGVVESEHQSNVGTLIGNLIAERSVKDENNESQVIGEYIIDNLYCRKGTEHPIGTIESQSEKTVDDFLKYYETGNELLDALNSGLNGVNDVINAHRDILYNSSWADLLKQCGAEEVEALPWKMNTEHNMPELCYCHEYTESIIEPTTTSNQFTVYTCKHCGKSYSVENEGTIIINTDDSNINDLAAEKSDQENVSQAQGKPETQPDSPISYTTTVVKPKATKFKKIKAGKKLFKATWKTLKGVSGYQLQYSTSKKFKKGKHTKKITVKKAKSKTKTVKKLKAGKKYYVRIRTYKTVKGKKVYSKWSKVKTVKTK